MAIFGTNKKETKPKRSSTSTAQARAVKLPAGKASAIILAPWFSEKALIATDKGVYAFAIPVSATKPQVAAAIKELYKVHPRKIAIVNLPGKRVSMRSRQGKATRARRRKAYVYLKPGETIQFA
jgi:large subunit ribosomal protein L23